MVYFSYLHIRGVPIGAFVEESSESSEWVNTENTRCLGTPWVAWSWCIFVAIISYYDRGDVQK